MSCKAWKPKA